MVWPFSSGMPTPMAAGARVEETPHGKVNKGRGIVEAFPGELAVDVGPGHPEPTVTVDGMEQDAKTTEDPTTPDTPYPTSASFSGFLWEMLGISSTSNPETGQLGPIGPEQNLSLPRKVSTIFGAEKGRDAERVEELTQAFEDDEKVQNPRRGSLVQPAYAAPYTLARPATAAADADRPYHSILIHPDRPASQPQPIRTPAQNYPPVYIPASATRMASKDAASSPEVEDGVRNWPFSGESPEYAMAPPNHFSTSPTPDNSRSKYPSEKHAPGSHVPSSVTHISFPDVVGLATKSLPSREKQDKPSGIRLSLDSLFRRKSISSLAPLVDTHSKPDVLDESSKELLTSPQTAPILDSHDDTFSPFEDMARPPLSLQGRDSTVVEPVLDIDTAEQIRNHLPPLLKETQRWELVYSMEQHGISLNTLFKRSEEQGGAVLFVLRDADDGIFGAFGTESIHIKTGYYGTGFCFLWKKDPSKASDDTNEPSKVAVYPATGENDYFMLSEPHFIAFGGGDGGFGLWIDDELFNGHSGPCQTFRNDQLSVKPEFELVALELWSISI